VRSPVSWTKLFKRFRFFNRKYKEFIRIDIVANSVNGNNDSYLEWSGFVESQLYILLNLVAHSEAIEEIRALPKSFKSQHREEFIEMGLMNSELVKFEFVKTYFFGLKLFKSFETEVVNLEPYVI
jgi:poly(A) polymerase Pap1